MNTQTPPTAAAGDWRGIGRPIVVGVLGSPALARLVEDAGVQVSLYETEESFRISEPAFTADVFDALVISREPWPDVDGVALARGLRRRLLGVVVVGASGDRYLVEERLAVLPVSATGGVRKEDLHAAVSVAAQETWALAPMRDPFAGGDRSEETTAEYLLNPEVLAVEAEPPRVSATPSQIRVDDAGQASRSTMIQLFDEDLVGLQAPKLAPKAAAAAAVAESGPTWDNQGTREFAPTQSMLFEANKGAFESDLAAAARVSPSARTTEENLDLGCFESDQPAPAPVARRAQTQSRRWFWSAVILGFTALGMLGALLWRNGG